MEPHDPLLPLWAMEWMASAFFWTWLFCLGATVGSFLNVVVYRLPLGKNLAYPGSFCPRCGHPVRGSDNIPILSWLALRGRCRDCRGRISPRYFFVELAVATLFLAVLAAEWYLPPGAIGFPTRRLLAPHDGPAFWCQYLIHASLLTTFLGFVLIVADGNAIGSRLFVPVTLIAFAVPLLWPQIRSVPAAIYPEANAWWAGMLDGLAGFTAALVFCQLRQALFSPRRDEWASFDKIGWAAAVGITLGWQRSLYALPVTAVLLVWSVRALRRLYRIAPKNGTLPACLKDTGETLVPATSETSSPPLQEVDSR
jgi:prepilin signal peptidase PulO-like enzyme (type II secretory pathway)